MSKADHFLFFSCFRRYCEVQGLDYPTGDCDPGWYCRNGSRYAQPTVAEEGGRCSEGQYCPGGSSLPFTCTEGMYCGSEELAEPTGECWAGYYCSGGAVRPDPTGDVTGMPKSRTCLDVEF